MSARQKSDPRLKNISSIIRDSLKRADINLPNSAALSTAEEIFQGLFGLGSCTWGCKEGCKRGCKDGCKNTQKE